MSSPRCPTRPACLSWCQETSLSADSLHSTKRLKASLSAYGLRFKPRKNCQFISCVALGNHYCDFSLSNKTRTLTLNGVRNDPSQFDESVQPTGAAVQDAYRAFEEKFHTTDETRVGDLLWTVHRFTVEGKEVVIDSINVAWCSNLQEDPGSLIFPHDRYTKYLHETTDLRLSVCTTL